MPDHIERERRNVESALQEARLHRNRLKNALAIQRQDDIIKQYEARLRDLDNQEWLDL